MSAYNWAIVSTGNIATQFATAMAVVPDARLSAVCSRTIATANAFADRFDPQARRFDDLDQMLGDPDADIDVVYIANPHPWHFETAKAALGAGKAVLCEKPMSMNAADTQTLVALAQSRGVFLMEAVWMRCMPALVAAKRLIDAGEIGAPEFVQAQFCIDVPYDPSHRLFSPTLGGGALLDLGIYPLAFADMFLGAPSVLAGMRRDAPTGVDQLFAMNACYAGGGAVAQMLCGTRFELPVSAQIVGTQGRIEVPQRFLHAEEIQVHRRGDTRPEVLTFPHDANGYEWEIREVHRALSAGATQSTLMPLEASVRLAQQMDQLLAGTGADAGQGTGLLGNS